jgi:lysophospholipase L1-like esterase
MTNFTSRRNFISLLTAVVPGTALAAQLHSSEVNPVGKSIQPFSIMFQGDSITDGNRGRDADPNHIMGHGYAFCIAARMGADYPERNLKFINRGISGNTITDLEGRWQKDTLDHKPDVVSILIGVNDVLAALSNGIKVGNEFEVTLRQLVNTTREALPAAVIVLGEPFILPVGMVLKNQSQWNASIALAEGATRNIAREFNCVLIEYQKTFTDACRRAPAEYWIWDGIHPTYSGHELMAREWIAQVRKRVPVLQK